MLDFIDEQFNEELLQSSFVFNNPNGIQMKQKIKDLEEIYLLFDEDGKGYIEGDKILLLFQVLSFVNQEIITFKVKSFDNYFQQYRAFCKKIEVYEGKLTTRLFKQFFIMNQLTSDSIHQQIKIQFQAFVGLQKYKLIDKSFFLSLTLNAKQKSLWIQNLNQNIDSSILIKEIQKNKQFNQQQLEKLVLCDQYVRLLYLFLNENFESLKYYFDMEQQIDIFFFSEELTRIFNSIYSQNSSIIMIDNVNTLFYIFADAYSILFYENVEIFFNIYSTFLQEKQFPDSSIKLKFYTYSYDEQNCLIKKQHTDLQQPEKIINKNKSENYIFNKQNIVGNKINLNKTGQFKQPSENDSSLLIPLNKKTYKQYKNMQQQPSKQKSLHNISYLTSPEKIITHHSFSPQRIKLNQIHSNRSQSPELFNQIRLYSTQSQILQQHSVESTPTGSCSMILYKTKSLSPTKQQGNQNYLEYLKSQQEIKKQMERSTSIKQAKIQSMIKSNWIEDPQQNEEQQNNKIINQRNQYE